VLELAHITFASADPGRLAGFWAALLDYDAARVGQSFVARGEGPDLRFERAERSPTIELPIHLDVNVADREAEIARVLALGGHLVETKSVQIGALDFEHTVMRDPEGNGFCLEDGPASARNHVWNATFASARPRELGRFWALALGWPDEDMDPSIITRFREAGVGEPDLSGFHLVQAPDGLPPRLYFHRREKSRVDAYPIRLDFGADDPDGEAERLAQAGASVVEATPRFATLRDPEGNPFGVARK
jgi:predicted enzyme related to lactoylglutathione lyase